MKITFVGTSTCIPDTGSEAASWVINDNVLVDTGWCNVLKMREYNLDPLNLEYLILTHLHQDHYIGLPQLLFYLRIKKLEGKYSPRKPFTIIGPSNLELMVKSAIEFLKTDIVIDLNMVSLCPGEKYINDAFELLTYPGKHFSRGNIALEALVCKFTELQTEKSVVFTGDTSFLPAISGFAKDVPLLIHDCCHSTPAEAAAIAKKANAGKLYLIHYPQSRKAAIIAEAKKIFPESFPAEESDILEI
ncbi:MAG: MBL fold metallo-hydrolase [Victivallaceae bacterium]|nr:MBL fold metallo-hydrolase [Victivallaceae bacterium]